MTDSQLFSNSDQPFGDDTELARGVLRAFLFDAQATAIDCPSSARGFSGAAIFRVQAGNRTFCLRRWPREGLSAVRLRELHHLLGHLKQSGIDVIPQPVRVLSGETLVSHGGTWWQLEPWMPGTADFNQSPTDERLRAAMQALAHVHRAAERYVARGPGRKWFACDAAAPSPAIRERLSLIADWTPERVDAALNRLTHDSQADFRVLALDVLRFYQSASVAVAAELRSLQDLRVSLHPCLRDVWHDHLLFGGNELTGLVDVAATRSEHVAADLSRLLGSLLGDDFDRWHMALEAYSAFRPVTEDERQLVQCLDRSSVLLSGLTWIDRRLTGRLCDADLPRVVSRLQALRGRLQLVAESSRASSRG